MTKAESLESQYATIHHKLIHLIDDLTFRKNKKAIQDHDVDQEFDALLSMLDPIIFTHLRKPNDTTTTTTQAEDLIKLNKFLRQMLEIKNLVYEQPLITAPILRSVNQAVNITDFERNIKNKIDTRDALSFQYLELAQSCQTKETELIDAQIQLKKLLAETKARLEALPKKKHSPVLVKDEIYYDTIKPRLSELRRLKLRTSILSELLLSMISALNVNWSQDDDLKRIVLSCGKIDDEDTDKLQDILDQVSSDEEEEEEEGAEEDTTVA